jgi:hypothetical protein
MQDTQQGKEKETAQAKMLQPVKPPATHIALPIAVVEMISKYFRQTTIMSWEESNPFVAALSQGVPVALPETEHQLQEIPDDRD